MSFDIFLAGFSHGKHCDLARDPFRAVLHKHKLEPCGDECYNVYFEDGSHVEADVSGLDGPGAFDCCAFYIIHNSDAIVRFIFELAAAGRGALFPTMEGPPCILVDAALRQHLPPDLGFIVVECPSPEELVRFLRGGYQDWSAYRDFVVNKYGTPDPK